MVDVILKVKPIKANRYAFRTLQHSRAAWQLISGSHTWCPPTDVYETENDIVVRMEIAGMRHGELSVTLDEDLLLIQGTRPSPNREGACHQLEIGYGEFQSGIRLRMPVVAEEAQASYQDGFLELRLPKKKAHQIEVKEQ